MKFVANITSATKPILDFKMKSLVERYAAESANDTAIKYKGTGRIGFK